MGAHGGMELGGLDQHPALHLAYAEAEGKPSYLSLP